MAKIMLISLSCPPDPISWLVFLVQSPGDYYLVCVQRISTATHPFWMDQEALWPPPPPLLGQGCAAGSIRAPSVGFLKEILSSWDTETLIFELKSNGHLFHIHLMHKLGPQEGWGRRVWRRGGEILDPFCIPVLVLLKPGHIPHWVVWITFVSLWKTSPLYLIIFATANVRFSSVASNQKNLN